MGSEWQPIETAPEGVIVRTKIDEGGHARNDQPLIRRSRLWYVPSESMYVYYQPTHWMPLPEPPTQPTG